MTTLNFLQSSFKNSQATIYLAPDFLDLSATEFPHGIPLGGQSLSPEDAESFIAGLQHFFTAFVEDFKYMLADDPAYFKTKHFTEPVVTVSDDYNSRRWSAVYWDAHYDEVNGNRLLPHVRFLPAFVDTEDAGFSHGISAFNQVFETEQDAFNASVKLENFMNVVLAELLLVHVKV